jgi:hypothetical protein
VISSNHPNLSSWVKYLVEERGLDAQERDKKSRPLLFSAVKSGNREIIDVMKYLENRGLDLHAKWNSRNVAFSAISSDNLIIKLEIVKYLRERDVDFTLRGYGRTVLQHYEKFSYRKRDEIIPKQEIEVILECLAAGAQPWWGKESGDPVGYLKNQDALTWRMLKEYE